MLTLAEQIGQRILALRKELKLSRAALARQVKTSRSHLSALERGDHVPSVETLARFSVALDTPLSEFFEPSGLSPRSTRLARRLEKRGVPYVLMVEQLLEHVSRIASGRTLDGTPGDPSLSQVDHDKP